MRVTCVATFVVLIGVASWAFPPNNICSACLYPLTVAMCCVLGTALLVLFAVSRYFRLGVGPRDLRVSAATDYFPGDLVGQVGLGLSTPFFMLLEGARGEEFAWRPGRLAIAALCSVSLTVVAASPWHKMPKTHNISAACFFALLLALAFTSMCSLEEKELSNGSWLAAYVLVAGQAVAVLVLLIATKTATIEKLVPPSLCVMGYMEWVVIASYTGLQFVLLQSSM